MHQEKQILTWHAIRIFPRVQILPFYAALLYFVYSILSYFIIGHWYFWQWKNFQFYWNPVKILLFFVILTYGNQTVTGIAFATLVTLEITYLSSRYFDTEIKSSLEDFVMLLPDWSLSFFSRSCNDEQAC